MRSTKIKKIFLTFSLFIPLILSACAALNNHKSPNLIVVNPILVRPFDPPIPTDPNTDTTNSQTLLSLSDAPMPIINWLKYNQNNESANPQQIAIPNYSAENKTVLDFFLRRTIALSMVIEKNNTSEIFFKGGTGTILGKASADPNSLEYYVATNIHVSNSFINNNPDQNIISYQFAINPLFNKYYNTSNFPSPAILMNEDLRTPLNVDSEFWIFRDENNKPSIALTKDFYNFTRPTTDQATNDRLFYQAANIEINPYNSGADKGVKLGADFSVMKIDFKTAKDQYQNKQSSKALILNKFLSSLQSLPDAQFAWTQDQKASAGYLAGFPSVWDNPIGIEGLQFINLAINKPKFRDMPILAEISKLEVNTGTKLKDSFQAPTQNINAINLNIGSGASGSLYINQEAKIEGIHWGVIIKNSSTDERDFDGQITGQITKLRVAGIYDLIGGVTAKTNTPHANSFCDVVTQKNDQDKTVRVPDFCN